MNKQELAQFIDHTLLKPDAAVDEIHRLVDDALEWGTIAVCVNSGYTSEAVRRRGTADLLVAATVGFPLGQAATPAKVAETRAAIEAGADEIDMVWNLGWFLSRDLARVEDDIAAVTAQAGVIPVKVILETARLSLDQIRDGCRLAVKAGARLVKTSTGFGFPGAALEAVRAMREAVGPDIGVKASGGIHHYADALALIEAGASRLGLSGTAAVLAEAPEDAATS